MAVLERFFSIIVFFLIPFLGNNHLALFYINIDKFWIETSFLASLILAVLLQYINRQDVRVSLRIFNIFFIPLISMYTIGLLYTWSIYSTLWEVNNLLWAGCCVSLYAFSTDRDRLMRSVTVGAFVLSVCALAQFIVLIPNLLEIFRFGRYGDMVRGQAIPVGSFLYHNILGGYLAVILPIALYQCSIQKKLVYILISSVIITGVILTTSRIAMAIAVGVILFSILYAILQKNLRGLFSILGVFILTGICIFSLFFAGQKGLQTGVPDEIGKKIKTMHAQITTLNTRTEIWKNGVSAFLNQPFAGHGAGSFEYAYRKSFNGGIYTQYSHSVIIKVLVEVGILGLIFSAWYMAGVLYGIRKSKMDQAEIFICIALFALLVFGILDFAFDTTAFVITFFILSFAMLPGSVKSAERSGLKHAFSFMVLILLASSFFFTVKSDLSKKSIENGTIYLEGGLVKNAYSSYVDAITEMPFDNEGRIKAIEILSNVYIHEKDPEKKETFKRMLLAHLLKAEKCPDKDSGLYFVTGRAYSVLGDRMKAEEYLLRAHSYYPSSAYYIFQIASYYMLIGDLKKAFVWTHAIEPYLQKYAASGNPDGLYIYKIRDLEATIYYKQGLVKNALSISLANLRDAEAEKYSIASVRAKEKITKEALLKYLKDRASLYEK